METLRLRRQRRSLFVVTGNHGACQLEAGDVWISTLDDEVKRITQLATGMP
jgi:hypothetical protein